MIAVSLKSLKSLIKTILDVAIKMARVQVSNCKLFVDGNPVDNLGETQGINIVPVQQTERFEIYKGVVPVELGTDALLSFRVTIFTAPPKA